jgi:hypothetical protein
MCHNVLACAVFLAAMCMSWMVSYNRTPDTLAARAYVTKVGFVKVRHNLVMY